MCGILALLLSTCSEDQLRSIAIKQRSLLRHRGPDWSGLHACKFEKQNSNSLLIHERLAIVGVDSGEQPLFNKDRTVSLCVNGEIYNHKQLKLDLDEGATEPYPYFTQSDCEVIIPLYERLNTIDVPRKLDGMYSFVITDTVNERIVIARDPIGITSLYYGWTKEGSLMVSSELKALEGVCERYEEFPPGHIYISDAPVPLQRYYTPVWWDEKYLPTTKPDLSILRNAFEKSVIKRLMCDVPYGVLLSGGLDSSLVASIAARHAAKRIEDDEKSAAWFPRLHSFSIGLRGSPDLIKAKEVADFLGTVHHSWEYTIQQGIDALKDVIYHIESYDVTTVRASTPMYLLSRRIKAMGIKMVLSGEGADEVFGGYLYFHKAPSAEEFHKETVRKIKALHSYDCLRAHKCTLAWGVEARVPFLDKQFLDIAMTMDASYKMVHNGSDAVENDPHRHIEKYIMRKAFDDLENPYLPADILWRQKEQFSDGVGYGWIDSLRDLAESKVSDAQMNAAQHRYPENTPQTKEAYFYRSIFHELFPSDSAVKTIPGGPSVACSTAAAVEWDPSFKSRADPSGRSVAGVHNDSY